MTTPGNMDKWLHLETWTMTTLGDMDHDCTETWTMTTLGDMDHDYTWGHGQVTALGDMDHDYTWGHGQVTALGDMDHDYTWGHGPWLHLGTPWLPLGTWTMVPAGAWTMTILGDIGLEFDYTWYGLCQRRYFSTAKFCKVKSPSLTLWVWQHYKFRTRLPKWALPCFATAGNWMAQHIFISNSLTQTHPSFSYELKQQ